MILAQVTSDPVAKFQGSRLETGTSGGFAKHIGVAKRCIFSVDVVKDCTVGTSQRSFTQMCIIMKEIAIVSGQTKTVQIALNGAFEATQGIDMMQWEIISIC